MKLEPCLIVVSGMATAGKTTIAKELTRRITNAAYLARDDAMYGGLLIVNDIEMKSANLPSFENYVRGDEVFPNFVETVLTPFGRMHRVIHANHNDFFWRHADSQSYLITARFAERLIELGKVAVVDAWFSPQHFRDGTVQAFLSQPAFAGIPRRFIFVAVGLEEAFRRWHARAEEDSESDLRSKSGYLDRSTFYEKMAQEQPAHPEGLEGILHFRLDTTNLSLDRTIATALDYVAHP